MSAAAVLPPDARLCKPKRPLPRGTVDCHAHIFDRFERYPLAPGRKYSPPPCTREAWLDLHAALGVERGGEGVNAPGFKVILRQLTERDDRWTKISSWLSPLRFRDARLYRLTKV